VQRSRSEQSDQLPPLAYKDENRNIRDKGADVLGQVGDRRAVGSLIKALGDEDLLVRQHAAESLGKLGDGRAVEPLIKALRDNDSFVFRL